MLLLSSCSIFVVLDFVIDVVCLVLVVDVNIAVETVFCSCCQVIISKSSVYKNEPGRD